MFKKLINTLTCLGLSSSLLALPVQAVTGVPFVDVKENSWFLDGVKYAYDNKIMTGLDPTHFGPSDKMNRAMLVTVLYRLENQPPVNGYLSFRDVPTDTYFTNAVIWASSQGIVTGYDTYRFGPDDSLTREQIATILKRYSDYKGKGAGSLDDLGFYRDTTSVSPFAVDGMKWAVGNGIITGLDYITLGPRAEANRAQVATILARFLKGGDLSRQSVIRAFQSVVNQYRECVNIYPALKGQQNRYPYVDMTYLSERHKPMKIGYAVECLTSDSTPYLVIIDRQSPNRVPIDIFKVSNGQAVNAITANPERYGPGTYHTLDIIADGTVMDFYYEGYSEQYQRCFIFGGQWFKLNPGLGKATFLEGAQFYESPDDKSNFYQVDHGDGRGYVDASREEAYRIRDGYFARPMYQFNTIAEIGTIY